MQPHNTPGAGMQPHNAPGGFGAPIPNINSPGVGPGIHRDGGDGRHGRGGHFRRGQGNFGGVYGGPVIYAVPYYVPVYTEVPVYSEAGPAPVEQPRPYDIRQYQGVAPAEPLRQQPAPESVTRYVTLLAFRDSTVLAVVDYWLQGEMLVYSTSLGVRTVVPIDRLDLALTQQLNFERNVPFILEARP